ncbi:hypothetical protein RHMOL_Rhmol03G0144000 [Rhododendron molle]|uniref:Uncharacterized protein n=1 Tax=Rhododendron molle TaxID=49168 RepID=A0ACC0PDU3_RHOML|nr:hypothetical protein RHMOL_Rhmol03G0144000 [Rhododendron molle]
MSIAFGFPGSLKPVASPSTSSPGHNLPPLPLQTWPHHQIHPHQTLHPLRSHRHRPPHRCQRLPLRLQRRQTPCLNLSPHHRVLAQLQSVVRVLVGGAEVHIILYQHGFPADSGGPRERERERLNWR